MEIGSFNEDGTFDIADVAETQQLILRTDTNGVVKTRWIYQNAEGKMIIHERSETPGDVIPAGSFLEIGAPGYAVASTSELYDNKKVAKLLVSVDWNDVSKFHTRTVDVDGEPHVAVLAPVKLL